MRAQRFRAVLLSVLMISLAQTAYISSLQGWAYPLADATSPMNSAGCDTATLGANDPMHVDGLNGDDSWAGTTACPKATIVSAVENSSGGDEVIVHEGLYHENITIDNKDDFILRAATGERVVLDGTRSIAEDLGGVWGAADSDGIQEVTLTQDGWQLFLAYEEQVPARWPNAQFSDETVFNRSYWAEGTLTGSNNAYTKGWLTDAGPEAGVHTGLNETVNATGLDPVGAIAVMNLGSFRSNSRIITDWNPNNGTFAYDGTGVGWKTKHHAYFLEGKRELIDQDGEWWYNTTDDRLHYKTPSGQDANDLDLRVKVQPFAISVDGSDGVTVQGIDFFGTTVNFNNCDGCSFTNATLEYPSTSKRGLGIAGESEDDRWMTRFYRSKHSFVDNISITNTDGGAIEFQGSPGQSHNNTVNNSYFHAIDWSAADQKGLMVTIYEGGRDMYFTNNTVHLTGASSVLSIGDAPKVFYNEVWDVGHLQTDGAVVQVMQAEAPGAEIAYNWIHDVIKYGARFDAPIGEAGEGRNGTMHHNVIWNAAGGLMVKGDYHDIHNNTVFNSTGKNDIIFLTDGGINNKNSTLHRNAVDSVADNRSDDVFAYPLPNGSHWNNWNGYVDGSKGTLMASNGYTCAIYSNGSLYCWGKNHQGQLGIGSTSSHELTPQYVDVGPGRTVAKIDSNVAGASWISGTVTHNCAILDNGSLACWGVNSEGQLGLGNMTNTGDWLYSPNVVDLGTTRKVVDLAVGVAHTCVILDNGSLMCWGRNGYGQVGIGTSSSTTSVLTPSYVDLGAGRTAVAVEASNSNTCAILDNGSVLCWGRNNVGQLGIGTTGSPEDTPQHMHLPAGRTVTSIGMQHESTCISFDNGSVACVGGDAYGQLGNGGTNSNANTLQYTSPIGTDAELVSGGKFHACSLNRNGSVICWGDNNYGTHGIGSEIDSNSPGTSATIDSNRFFTGLTVGYGHVCANLDNGSVACWGRNAKGELGLGNLTKQTSPVMLSSLGALATTAVHEMLVDPANKDFRPKWGSNLQILGAGAYDAGDADPWTAGVSWTYSPMSNPIAGCMDAIAMNYDSDAVFSDGSCIYTTLTSSASSLSLFMGRPMSHALDYSTVFLADGKQTAASSGAVGVGTHIALDSNGDVHICSKLPGPNNDLYYTTNSSGSWESAVVDSGGNLGGDCFIILDSDDDIHITYRDDSNTNLKYATKALSSNIAASNWDISTMDNNGDVGNFGSMAVDADDRLHVAYYSAYSDCLKYATKDDGSSTWSREVVESANDIGKFTSIALDSHGKPHITYRDTTNTQLRYAHKMGSSWETTTIDSTSLSGSGTSLAIDSNDHLHVAYKTNSTEIAYMTNRSGSWVKTTLDANSTGNWGVNYIDIMLDEGDDPHVVYSDMVDYDIFYMSNTRGAWERTLVAGDSISKTSSATMDSDGGIHVAYYIDGSLDDVGYAAVRSFAHVPTFEIEPDLPNGLTFDAETGTISGTPSELLESTEFTVWANTTRTSAKTTLTLDVDWALNLDLIPSAEGRTLTINQGMFVIGFTRPMPSFGASDIATSASGANDVHAADIDGDGDLDLVSASYTDDTIAWYENDGAANPTWTAADIATSADGAHSVYVADMDGDGDLDIVSASYHDDTIAWYENDGAANPTWTAANIATSADGARSVYVADMDGDGDLDIVSASEQDDAIAWYENDGAANPTWTAADIATSADAAQSVYVADMDGDGDLDIVSASYHDDTIAWYENDGAANPSWTAADIATSANGANSAYVADMDGDGDLDIVSASYNDDTVAWYETDWTTSSTSSVTGATCGSSPDLPAGLSMAFGTCSITGTPTTLSTNTTYTIYANYSASGLQLTTTLYFSVNDVAPNSLEYAPDNMTLEKGTAMTPNLPTVSGGTVTSWEIDPSLPNGLTWGTSDGKISGTPTGLQTTTETYTVWANNSGGSASAQVNITINDVPPGVTYGTTEITATKNVAISPSIGPTTSGGAITSWEISPSPGSAFTFNSATGTIGGTPTVLLTRTQYTIWANNSGGSAVAYVNVTVNDVAPNTIVYASHDLVLEKGTAMATATPAISGGSVTQWEIDPAVPSGLSFSSTTGAISGTPSILQTSAVKYTVWANNSGGTASTEVNITINDQVASIAYPTTVEVSNDRAMTTVTPTNTGGAVTSWEIDPSLPSSLSFGSTNGSIWGTPTGLLANATYTVYANNSGGSSSATFTLGLNWTLTPSAEGAYITRNSSIGSDITFQYYNASRASFVYANTMMSTAFHTCAILDNGDLKCWGQDTSGQLGDGGSNSDLNAPPSTALNLGTGRTAVAVSAGYAHTCVILDNGDVKCWGNDGYGQLGNGPASSTFDSSTASVVNLGTGRTAVAVSAGYEHTCAILDNGDAKCWGSYLSGRLGDGGSATSNVNAPSSTPINLGTGRTAVDISTGQKHTCAVLDNGSIACWGSNHFGQLGHGGSTGLSSSTSSPVITNSLGAGRTAVAVSAGTDHTCALLDNGEVKCWGRDNSGQLGDGGSTNTDTNAPPSSAINLGTGRTAVSISAGQYYTCAILDNGDAKCWGSDTNGRLGDGGSTNSDTNAPSSTPINLGTGRTAVALAAGHRHTCAILDNGVAKCWGADFDGQLGNGGFITNNYAASPVSVTGSNTWDSSTGVNTGMFSVSGATCAISPSLPTGMSLTTGPCTVTGTPTVTAVNATYTVWANFSGTSYSGQIYLEVGLNAPIPSYAPASYTYTKGTTISTLLASNTGGEVTTWGINATLPSGLSFGTSNGSIWGTPDTVTPTTTYTVYANNSAGSSSTTITFTVNDPAPYFSYTSSSGTLFLNLYLNQTINPVTPITFFGGGLPTSCSASPSLPSGLILSPSCVISGTPNATSSGAPYVITGTNTGGSDSDSIYIQVIASGGPLTITPTSREGEVNSTLTDITMSYGHAISNYGWTSGVSNASSVVNNAGTVAGSDIVTWDNGDVAIAWARPIYGSGSTVSHVLALSVYSGGSWSTQDIDTASRTGYKPSMEIDKNGALHIAYIDRDNTRLRYATNATSNGAWSLSTLDESSPNPNNDWVRTGLVLDTKGHVHIIHPVQGSGVWLLNHTTNVSGSFVSTTITNTSADDGKYASLAIAGDDSLHISVYRDSGGSDLRYYTDETGVWTNETVHTGSNYGKDSVIALNSKDEVVIVYRHDDSKDDIYMSVGNRGSWTSSLVAQNRYASWLSMAIDSNDDVHISSHSAGTGSYCCNKDMEYFTNASGNWVMTTLDQIGGEHAAMVIDANDDVHIAHSDIPAGNDLKYATVQGSGKGLTPRPVFTVTPDLPDGLVLNWKNGTVSGTPTNVHANTTHTVTVTALGATTQGTFTLHITGAPGDIAYADISGTAGFAITPATPTVSTNGTTGSITTWAINATPPSGLTFEASNGTIWGTPTQVVSGAVFTVWANNSVGSSSTTVNITVGDVLVSSIVYAPENFSLTYYHTLSTTTPSTTGGMASSWGIHPSLPSGLSFNTATGAISGTPELLQTTAITYTVWANNSAGSYSDQINITVNDHAPVPINAFSDNITLDYNQSMAPIGGFEMKHDTVALSEDHSCAIKDDGTVRCWGSNGHGGLGIGSFGGTAKWPQATNSLGVGRYAIDITVGASATDTKFGHSCALLDDGSVVCWGRNNEGQLGDNTTTNRHSPTPTVPLPRPAVAVEAGFDFTCALLDNGSVMCWGWGSQGRLGNGGADSLVPTYTNPIPGGRRAVAIDISHYHACAVLEDGHVACWGPGGGGRLGTGNSNQKTSPTLINYFNETNRAVDVALGRYTGCGLLDDGRVTCWGQGYLGNGGSLTRTSPGLLFASLGTGRTAVDIEMGRHHACAILDNGVMKCWGTDQYGQMGNGNGQSDKNNPSTVNFATGIEPTGVYVGHWHTCITAQTNELYCWGDGEYGKLGDGSTAQNNWAGASAKANHFSGTNPVKAHGDITSWAIHPSLPTGLSFGSSNGTIWGTPTASIPQTNFTIYANNSGGSSSLVLNLGVNPDSPGPFEYIPENNTVTNNSLVHIAPSFVNITTGNGSTWRQTSYPSNPGSNFVFNVNGILYFNGDSSQRLWALNQSNGTTWRINSSVNWVGEHMAHVMGDSIYFSAHTSSVGREFFAYTTTNQTMWLISDIRSGGSNSNPGSGKSVQSDDHLFFRANDGGGSKWHAYNTSNATLTKLSKYFHGGGGGTSNGQQLLVEAMDDTLYIAARETHTTTQIEVWAYSASNLTAWVIEDIHSGSDVFGTEAGYYGSGWVNGMLFFDAWNGVSGDPRSIWVYNPANATAWELQSSDSTLGDGHLSSNKAGCGAPLAVDEVAYFCATGGSTGHELWAYNTSNETAWLVEDLNTGVDDSIPGRFMFTVLGDTLYFSASTPVSSLTMSLWAHDVSNGSSWHIPNQSPGLSYVHAPGWYSTLIVGDAIYFDASNSGAEPWVYDTSNQSAWMIEDINPGLFMGGHLSSVIDSDFVLLGDTIYFRAADGTSYGIFAHQPAQINHQTNTGGPVTSWAINTTNLPTGLTFSTTNGTIYGTPTELWTQTSYMVWANNSGGSTVAYLNITVVDEVPTLSYSPSTFVLTKGNQSSDLPLNATLTGPGEILSWAINTTLPAGLNFGTSNGTIWGIPTVLQTTATTYTVWANNTGGSTSATVTITINDEAPGPFEYNPENNIWTNNTEVHLAPNFVNITTGNGTTWMVTSTIFQPSSSSWDGICFAEEVDGVLYLAGSPQLGSTGLFGYGLQNHTTWHVSTIDRPGCYSYVQGIALTVDLALSHHVGDTLYFSGTLSNGTELYAYNTVNTTTWLVADINQGTGSSNPGAYFFQDAGEVILFSADDGSSGHELWGHNTSNGTTWRVADINSGSGSSFSSSNANNDVRAFLGDVVLFKASDGSGRELWAYNLTNTTVWQAANLSSGVASPWGIGGEQYQLITVGDVAYFGAIVPNSAVSEDRELYAYNVTNQTTWAVTDLSTNTTTGAKVVGLFWLNDVLYFKARVGLDDGYSCVAHAPANATTWIKNDGFKCPADFAHSLNVWIGGTLYSGTSAYNPDNQSTWNVINSTTSPPNTYTYAAVGDVLYFSAGRDGAGDTTRRSLWAHDTTNGTTWFVEGSNTTTTNYVTPQFIHASGNTSFYQHAVMSTISLMAVQAAEINSLVNSGGTVISYAINASLPSGVSFGTNNGTIYGTPTELWTQTSYMVWANNSGGSSVAYLNITVEADLADISYDPSSVTVTRGYDIAPITANNTGAEVLSWAISPALPSGLSFENGTVYGRPLVNMSATAFTVYANNSAGSATAILTLTVNEPTPNVDYSPDNYTLTNGTSYTITPTLLGQTGNISSIMGAGSASAGGNGCTFGDLLIFKTDDWRLWAFNSSLSASTSNPYVLATNVSFTSCTDRIVHNGTMYFRASTNSTGAELWKTDGTTAGTSMVKDIRTGTTSSSPSAFFVFNDEVHFEINVFPNGNEIWKTNGTSSGTLKATNSACWHYNCNFASVIEYNGSFYGAGSWNNNGREVLMYNSSGLSLLVDLSPGQRFSIPRMTNPSNFIVHDGWLWFLTNGNPSSGNGNCLYRSNGTAAGTTPFVCDTSSYGLELFNDELYFSRSANGKGYELWKTDGTTSGTVMVTDIVAGSGSAVGPAMARLFTSTDDYLYFSVQAGTANTDHAVWRTDGTTAGTQLIKSSFSAWDDVVIGNVLYMSGQYFTTNSDSSTGLWSTDGTTNGTSLYTNYDGDPLQGLVSDLHTINGSLYFRYYNGTGYTYGQMGNASGAIVGQPSSWSISPSLPDGLNFGTNNGTIWGTPTALNSTAQYTITATNANGSSTTTINITVVDEVPVLSYTPASVELTNNTAHPDFPLLATVTGSGVITSWAINDSALPTGVFFGTTNGTFWGTPTQLWPETNYTVWANNSGGSTSATVTISVIDQVPTLAYAPSSVEMTNNTASSDFPLAPSLSGPGDITSWAINDSALPTGVFFGTTNGTFWGTPTQLWQARTYTVWANNSGGSASATVTLEVVDQVPVLSYSPDAVDMVNNTVHADFPLAATLTGPGEVLGWVLNNSALPSGVFFGTTNGTFWGTPTELWPETTYTIWANNSGGSTSATVTITVVDQVPVLSYSPNTIELRNNTAHISMPLEAILTGPGDITSWAINDSALPSGVFFGTTNGTFWGTPTQLWPVTSYTVWANNSGGTASATVTISVVDQIPTLSYVPSSLVLTNNTAHADMPLHAVLTGPGDITSWAINDSVLPTGLNFGTTNGTFWGTPTALWPSTSYTVWANNSGGSVTATVSFSVIDQIPTFAASSVSFQFTNNTTSPDLPYVPLLNGPGLITSWAMNGTLPSGLVFEPSNGTLWGVPTQLWPSTSYTIWANNSGGSSGLSVTLEVVDQLPALTYTPATLELVNNTAHADLPLEAILTGPGVITSWVLVGELPEGLTFGTTNGTVWGIATELWPETTYTVWANNSGGSSSATLVLSVVDQLPTLSYVPDVVVLTNNTAHADLPLHAVLTGPGEITSWVFVGELPEGLTFEASNGTLWGVATELWPETSYTVYANNSGGSSSATLMITVIDQLPNVSYVPDVLDLVKHTPHADLPLAPVVTGPGLITSWAIDQALPFGVQFSTENGTFWGTPTELWPVTTYTVWANNSGGSVMVTVTLGVVDQLPTLSYTPEHLTLVVMETSTELPLVATLEGPGDITSWVLSEALPQGLFFSTTNGTVWGMAEEVWSNRTYTVWANNSGGSTSATFSLEVISQTPRLLYAEDLVLIADDAMPSWQPFVLYGSVDTWAVEPDLPDGLVFNDVLGRITGTPTTPAEAMTWTVWTNATGVAVPWNLTITVLLDTDDDGMPNALPEGYFGTLIEDLDDDNDGLLDVFETDTGVFLGPEDIGTDPLVVDTDADTWDDAEELTCGADPTNASDVPVDTDGDGLCDALEADPDGDGYSTQEELACFSDPMNATSIPVDVDGDGACDALLQPDLSYTNVSDAGTGVVLLGHPARFDAVVVDATLEAWTIVPALPKGLVFNATDGSITGVVQDSDVERPSSTHTVFATEVGYGRIIEVEVTFTFATDSDGDGLADSDPDGFGPMRGDLDDDDDGWNDTIEAACGSDPLDVTSYPSTDFILVDGACVDASAKPFPPVDDGPSLFTMCLLFWVAVAFLALLHRSGERKEHRKKLAAEKDAMITKMIAEGKQGEEE